MTNVVVVSSASNFGNMASIAVAELQDAFNKLQRVNAAITEAGGYTAGSPAGSAFEITSLTTVTNNFGVVQSSTGAGGNGGNWAYAVATLEASLATFMSTNAGQIAQIDQGIITLN